MSVHKKLMEARLILQETKLTKSGLNKFAGYSYFELADFIPATQKIFGDLGLCGVVSYTAEIAQLTITDIETDKSIVITSPMEGANLKGCHPIQNLGAVETYQRRYLWVTAMEILEHDALDSSDGVKEEKTAEVKVITADQATLIKDALSETKSDVPVFLSLFGVGIDSVEKIPARMYTKAKTMLENKKNQGKCKPELCSDKKFIENSAKWEAIVASGKKTADDLISFIITKAELTEDQKQEIRSWEKDLEDS